MKIEIIEYYPVKSKNKKVRGSLHIYLEDFDLDFRGLVVCSIKGKPFIAQPFGHGNMDGKPCRYPYLSFADRRKQSAFTKQVQAAFIEHLKKNRIPFK